MRKAFSSNERNLEEQDINMNWQRKYRSCKCSRWMKVNRVGKAVLNSKKLTIFVPILRHPIGRDECQHLWHAFYFIVKPRCELCHVHYVLTWMLQAYRYYNRMYPRGISTHVYSGTGVVKYLVYNADTSLRNFIWFPHVYFFIVSLILVFMFLSTKSKDKGNIIVHVFPSLLLSACFKLETGGRILRLV